MKIKDTTKSIFRSATHFLGGTAISRISGCMRDVAIAFAFGTHSTIAAFMVAFRLAHLMRRLLGEGALQSAFIPQFEEIKDEDPLRACRFFSNLYGFIILLLSLLIPITIVFLYKLVSYGILSSGNKEIVELTIVMLPSLIFICLFGLNSSLLQCEKKYFTTGVAPTIFNLIWISGVLIVKNWEEEQAMIYLGIFIIFAAAGQWLMTVPSTYTALKSYGHSKPWQKMNFFDKDLWRLVAPLLLGVLGVAASQVNNFLDALFARYAGEEGPAYLWYAIRAQQLPLSLFAVSLSGALLPPLSRVKKEGDMDKFSHFISSAMTKTIVFMVPLTFGIFIFGDSGINFVFGRGNFTNESIFMTTECLWGYGMGLFPMSLVIILAPGLYALNQYKVTTIASVLSMCVNVLLNALFIMVMGYGPFSVAIATSISAWLNFLTLWVYSVKLIEPFPIKSHVLLLCKMFVASIFGAILVYFLDVTFYGGSSALAIIFGEVPNYTRTFHEQFLHLFCQAGLFFSVIVLSIMINLEELARRLQSKVIRNTPP